MPVQRIGANDNEKITDTLYTNRENLEAIFRLIDLDCNGLITMDEFKEACDQLTGKIRYIIIFIHFINFPCGNRIFAKLQH